MSGGRAEAKCSGQPSGQIFQPIKRPSFVSPDEYHRFSSTGGRPATGEVAEAAVVKTPLKQKLKQENTEAAKSSEWTTSPGCAEMIIRPLQTPVSAKGGRACGRLKVAKYNKSGPQTLVSNAGYPSGNPVTPVGTCRYDNSLGLLTKKFINLLKRAQDGILDLNKAAETLEVQKRRIYDITNVLEGIGLIEKKLKNRICWKGLDDSRPAEIDDAVSSLQVEVESLSMKDHNLENYISEMQQKLRDFCEDENNQKWLYVTEDDIKGIPCFKNETLIAIKAPHGTTLEVPDPDEAVDYPLRRYRIVLRSTMGPIDVYLVSQFEEKFEELSGMVVPPSLPPISNSRPAETAASTTVTEGCRGKVLEVQDPRRMCTYLNSSQDLVGGMMKIVPSDVDIDADYWLLSDADVSITDMWGTSPEVPWDLGGRFDANFMLGSTSIPWPQTPSSSVAEVLPSGNSTQR
ncbi:transcription factor E2FB-like isoform X2 [Phoenix dactylifera]|uniref:Transcription factor E2FB-like isoform X2 n=1 Tax=Phoenix dactylifera TaxID=42345 RepID=A0A8B7CZB7_PHODC|nr:transcription factor E2FB-like isoform X2 [Phoenix dactylifera]